MTKICLTNCPNITKLNFEYCHDDMNFVDQKINLIMPEPSKHEFFTCNIRDGCCVFTLVIDFSKKITKLRSFSMK